jgi:hypothetical protein
VSRRTRVAFFFAVVGALVSVNVGIASIAGAATNRAYDTESARFGADALPIDATAGRAYINLPELRADHSRGNARQTHGISATSSSGVQLRVARVIDIARALAPSAQMQLAVQSRAPPRDRS